MRIAITKNGKEITKAKFCNNPITSMLGLMFSKPKAAVLKTSFESVTATTIHTFFMRFSIDAIWLNKDKKIVDIKRNIKPYRILIAPKKKAMYVVEIPSNKRVSLKEGDQLKFCHC